MSLLRGSGASGPAQPLLAIATVLVIALAISNCGEIYRPVAQPVLGPQPNPAASHFVVSISSNGNNVFVPSAGLCEPSGMPLPCVADHGAASRIDVAGDGILGIFQTGMNPTHAALTPNGAKLYIAASGEDLIYANNPAAPTALAATIALPAPPPGALTQPCPQPALSTCVNFPVFIATTEDANAYVANYSGGTLSVINTTLNVVTATVPVGLNPVSLAELPNAQQLYVANLGSGTITVISTTNNTAIATIALGSGAKPIWAAARSDSARVYVLDQSGTIYDVDTLANAVTGTSASVGAGANFLFYDKVLNRLYVTNPTNSQVAILDASADPPRSLSLIDLSTQAPASCLGCAPTSVTVLGDGSRAYVGTYQLLNCMGTTGATFPCVSSGLAVIDGPSASLKSVIGISSASSANANTSGCGPVSGPPPALWQPGTARFRVFASSSGGGANSQFKVYLAQCDAGSTAIVYTYPANGNPPDSYAGLSLTAPLSSFPVASGQTVPPPQNPVFVVAGP